MIETEKRVLLTEKETSALKEGLLKNIVPEFTVKRFTMISVLNSDFSPTPDNPIDLKIRTTGDKGKFTIKYGNWHASASREEYEIEFSTIDIRNLLKMLKVLGHKYYILTYVTRVQYDHRDLKLTIDTYHSMNASILEVEGRSENEIDEFLAQNNLNALNSEDTIALIKKMNEIPEYQVNFERSSIDEWCKDHESLIFCFK